MNALLVEYINLHGAKILQIGQKGEGNKVRQPGTVLHLTVGSAL